jgi:L-threonylcarbamoyladenylate synthase
MIPDLAPALAALRRGEVVGVPTDTVYGLAVAIDRPDGLERLMALKGRPEDKAVPILAASLDEAAALGVFPPEAVAVAGRHWPGPVTIVVGRTPGSPSWVGDAAADTVGLRVPDHPVALALLEASGPLAVSSANRSGAAAAPDHSAAAAEFGTEVAVYLPGAGRADCASTVLSAVTTPIRVLRPGPVPWPEGDTDG